MFKLSTLILVALFGTMAVGAAPQQPETKAVTWTGWFSDDLCATPVVKRGKIAPNGTECVKKCLAGGATPVFISEQAKALFAVREHPSVREDVGYRVEVTGLVDEKAETIAVQSVKRLEEVVPSCGQPPKKTTPKGETR